MVHKASRPGLKSVRNAAVVILATLSPLKLPDTTNLVFTRRRNEYSEMTAMAESVREENKVPHVKADGDDQRTDEGVHCNRTYALPEKQTPDPNE